ncbi:MAG: peptidylprolyl isomerase [Elusimicrobia bacterium]|nr:peptidylprolyl isomerase [Elusimicrobiota bacterium]
MRRFLLPGFFVVFCFFLSSCSKSGVPALEKDKDSVLLKLGPVYLTKAEMEARILELGPEYVPYLRTEQGKKTILEAIAKQKLLVRHAMAQGLDDQAAFKAELARLRKEQDRALRLYRESLLTDSLLTQLRQRELKVSDEETARYFREHPKLYSVRQILLGDEKKAEEVYSMLVRPGYAASAAEFGRVAAQNSLEAQSASAGGRIPPFLDGELEESFTRTAASMAGGQISRPMATKVGYHLIYFEGSSQAAFNDEIKQRVKKILERRRLDGLIEEWKKRYVMEVRDETLRQYLQF